MRADRSENSAQLRKPETDESGLCWPRLPRSGGQVFEGLKRSDETCVRGRARERERGGERARKEKRHREDVESMAPGKTGGRRCSCYCRVTTMMLLSDTRTTIPRAPMKPSLRQNWWFVETERW